ncbi:TPA: hypothetical protein DCZ46_01030 [Candidatus Campbellbacteria bacterium]|nr:MAG: amino acid ABC transporter substrate-binding protein, branched-chain amino acid transport system substrate-binding protein [Candidatus Campbellbacteria bacterium GW2011_OD1_34_28]KKP75329.1 MAG: Amino acid/amide ABC transporter substrate-binding protein, HAAT family [Candidatus Campbellbacteria bacterium GW2011_GWD2_35_24]KKP76110.1 MAG: amino acid ABC transporter substrate-binding protein, branched-chain amino acid transport system substrate-binding protein [Candidatus Campbellbacteria b
MLNKSLKILLMVILIVFATFLLIQTKDESVIKIGVAGHFSGDYASYGVPMKNAIELAFSEKDPQKEKYQVIYEDDGAESSKAVSVINKLIDIDKVNYILSAQGSGATSSIIPVVKNKEKILMITLASAPNLTKNNDYIFRSVPSDSYQGVKMVDYINNVLESERVVGLYVNETYGIGIKEIIENNTNSLKSELFKPGTSDFRTSLLKIKSVNPDTIVLVARENEYPLLLKQIHELNIDANIITSETFKDDKILNNSGDLAEGVITFLANSPDTSVFDKKYKDMFGVEPSAYSIYAYDGAIALIKSVEEKKSLADINFSGVSGEFIFDEDGDRSGIQYDVFKVIDGRFVKQP